PHRAGHGHPLRTHRRRGRVMSTRSALSRISTLTWLPAVGALAVPPAVAAAMVPVRGHTDPTNLALVMVVAVVAVAVPGRRGAAALAGLGAGLWFDFFLTHPYYSFAISHHNEAETPGLLLVVRVVVGDLTARGRRAREHAVTATDDIAR